MSAPSNDDELCRPLNPSEKQWLAQSSLICLIAHLSSHVSNTVNKDSLRHALSVAQKKQPFLKVCVDIEALQFKLAGPTPITFENIQSGSSSSLDDVRDVARAQLIIGVDRSTTFGRLHVVTNVDDGTVSFVCLCDHICLDGKSLVCWIRDILSSLSDQDEKNEIEMLPFIDWTTRCVYQSIIIFLLLLNLFFIDSNFKNLLYLCVWLFPLQQYTIGSFFTTFRWC
jgi:hypothetical protein